MKKLLVLAIAILISGCATGYQKSGFGGGFNETQLSENVWKVHFRGNAKTSMERATDFCLLRSAELTLENGYKYFAIINEESDTKSSAFTTPQSSYTNAYGYTTFSGGQTFTANKPRTQNTIFMLKEKTDKAGMVFEAQFIVQSLRNKYSSEFKNK